MNIKEIKANMSMLFQETQVITPYMHGRPGIGKSEICAQIAKERDISFIDLRLSQLESADLRGIPTPDLTNNSSKWLPPETLPFEAFKDLYVPGVSKEDQKTFSDGGILLLDEFNRARFDVIQAAFQLVLDRRVGLHKLLDNWFIVCAGNLGEEDNTEVTEIDDSALNNRFIHFYVDSDGLFDPWLEWAEGPGEVHSDIINFLKGKPSALYTDYKSDDVVFCTPRTWSKFSSIFKQNPDVDPKAITTMIGKALLGPTAVTFMQYLNTKSKISPKEVLLGYSKVKAKIQNLTRDEKYSLTNEVIVYIQGQDKVTDSHIKNMHDFTTETLDADHMIAIYKVLVNTMIKYKGKEVEFMDAYLDAYPDMNEKISDILHNSKED